MEPSEVAKQTQDILEHLYEEMVQLVVVFAHLPESPAMPVNDLIVPLQAMELCSRAILNMERADATRGQNAERL